MAHRPTRAELERLRDQVRSRLAEVEAALADLEAERAGATPEEQAPTARLGERTVERRYRCLRCGEEMRWGSEVTAHTATCRGRPRGGAAPLAVA